MSIIKKFFPLCFLLSVGVSSAQDSLDVDQPEAVVEEWPRNEVSLDILDLLAFGVLDISYEYALNDYSSLSVEVFNKLFNKNDGEEVDLSPTFSKDFALTGKFKYFWEGKPQAQGLYALTLLSFSHGKEVHDVQRNNPETGEEETVEHPLEFSDLAFGVGVGYKYVTKPGFFVDASASVGRNLFHQFAPNFAFLSNLSIGYRF